MNKEEALRMLKTAPRGSQPSKVNSALTQTQVVDLVECGVESLYDGTVLESLFMKRVLQVCQNRKHPKR